MIVNKIFFCLEKSQVLLSKSISRPIRYELIVEYIHFLQIHWPDLCFSDRRFPW